MKNNSVVLNRTEGHLDLSSGMMTNCEFAYIFIDLFIYMYWMRAANFGSAVGSTLLVSEMRFLKCLFIFMLFIFVYYFCFYGFVRHWHMMTPQNDTPTEAFTSLWINGTSR